jgi:lipopolysaccharide export system permease protein
MIEEIQIHLPLRRTQVEWFRKFTVAFACFIFFFIGAPLGAIIRKGGLGTPVIVSMLFFVVYYVIDISGKKLATDGSVSAFMGTFISAMILLPLGIFLTYKATTDSALFNKDAYLLLFKKVKKLLPGHHADKEE